jgi:lysophospholipase L1-like esterase
MQNYLEKLKYFKPLTVVCIGDSTTSQEWVHPNWLDWLTFTLKQQEPWPKGLNRRVINSGRDGAFIHEVVDEFERQVGMYEPDVVIASFGFNDIELAGKVDMEEQLSRLFSKIQHVGANLVTWSTYAIPHLKHSKRLKVISEQYRTLTETFEGVFVDMYAEFERYNLDHLFTYTTEDGNELWEIPPGARDFLHCNEIGNYIMADKIAREVFESELLEWESLGNMKKMDTTKYLKEAA